MMETEDDGNRMSRKGSSFVLLVGVDNTAISTLELDVSDAESGKCACKQIVVFNGSAH